MEMTQEHWLQRKEKAELHLEKVKSPNAIRRWKRELTECLKHLESMKTEAPTKHGDKEIQIGTSVKVVRLSSRYRKYLFRPRSEGVVIDVEDERMALVCFVARRTKGWGSYYHHPHWFYFSDLKVTHHRKGRIETALNKVRERYKVTKPPA